MHRTPQSFVQNGAHLLFKSHFDILNQHLRQFTQKHLKDEIAHSCSHPNAKKLYKTILEQSYLTSDDIIPLIPLQEFEKVFVSSDVLCESRSRFIG